MSNLLGLKSNKCVMEGAQGVIRNVVSTNPEPGTSAAFQISGPKNNTQYVLKEFGSGLIALMPEEPTADFNFKLTVQRTSGFTGTLATFLYFTYTSASSTSPEYVTIKWDNPDFDVTDNYTVIHAHIWYDGINYCGHIDGYV